VTTEPITAILAQLAAHAEQLARLDARERGNHAATSEQIAGLAALARAMDAHIAALASHLGPITPGTADSSGGDGTGSYIPVPSPRWWQLTGQDREQAISRLRAWVDEVHRPGYGRLAAALGPCWDQHPLCLYALDILAELWSVLHLGSTRTPALLSAQAEYQARILPALAEQMTTETTRCPHARAKVRAPAVGYPRITP
jgi:hypothetical protein